MKQITDYLEANYPEERISAMIDEEIMEWIDTEDSDFVEGEEYEWYSEHNNGEAEDVVRNEILINILNQGDLIGLMYTAEIHELIKQHCNLLDV